MIESKLIPEAEPHLFQAPIPGQSLTNSPDQPYPWERPPEITTQKEAMNKIFLEIIKPDNMETLGTAMSDGIPIAGLAEVLIKTSFQKGKINPDLAITLMEPVMYMLLSVAEKIGVDPVLSDDEEDDRSAELEDPEVGEENVKFTKRQEPTSLKELPSRSTSIPTAPPEIKQQLDKLDTSKVRESILQKQQPQANSSLLNKSEVV
jgi:hypothetical protein|tara:strand:- start:54 stop:668 length:615 start_codon:yes stop_codon:yes gene_type:complete